MDEVNVLTRRIKRKLMTPQLTKNKMRTMFGISRNKVNKVWQKTSTSHEPSQLVLTSKEVTELNTFFATAVNLANAKELYNQYKKLKDHSELGFSAFSIRLRKFRTLITCIKSSKKKGNKSW